MKRGPMGPKTGGIVISGFVNCRVANQGSHISIHTNLIQNLATQTLTGKG